MVGDIEAGSLVAGEERVQPAVCACMQVVVRFLDFVLF